MIQQGFLEQELHPLGAEKEVLKIEYTTIEGSSSKSYQRRWKVAKQLLEKMQEQLN